MISVRFHSRTGNLILCAECSKVSIVATAILSLLPKNRLLLISASFLIREYNIDSMTAFEDCNSIKQIPCNTSFAFNYLLVNFPIYYCQVVILMSTTFISFGTDCFKVTV